MLLKIREYKITKAVNNELLRDVAEPAFYFLTDHLGSSSYITNDNGQVTQTMSYTPFGEWQVDFVNFNASPCFATTYKFSGKEKDEETGFGYFGARYYYDYLSIWLSTDPLADKYPSLSPYVYCANNPIKLIDPNGMEIDWYQNKRGHTMWAKGNAQTIERYGETWKNIGERYSYKDGNTTYNYNQNDLETIDYTTGAKFQAQKTGTGCKVAADNMVKSSGGNPKPGREGEIPMAKHRNGVVTTPTANAYDGVKRIENTIESGHAITIGIDYKTQQQHNFEPQGDGMTDHFITVVGMTFNVKTGNMTYQFFDPGSPRNGSNASNTMSWQGGFLQGKIAFGKRSPFKVTTVRKTD